MTPGHLRAHQQFLQNACRKWAGSHAEMEAFAQSAARDAPAGSPLGHLIAIAHLERWLDMEEGRGKYIRSADVRRSLQAAAEQSVRHPVYRPQRGWPYVHNMFAMAFAMAEEQDAAAEQFDVIGDQVTHLPWGYAYADPGAGYCKLRAIAYARRRT